MKPTELKILVVSALLFVTASVQALQPEVLYAFQVGPSYPTSGLVQGKDGDLYGTSTSGGSGYGTVFKVTTNGVLTTLVLFDSANGARPLAGLVLGTDGNFYGTTEHGGGSNHGTVFKVTTNGVLTSLVSFNGTNGAGPNELVLGSDGYFYGTTANGGTNNHGTVFKMTTNGMFISLASFTAADGRYPSAKLALGNDGSFYGTTWSGGSGEGEGYGTVFRVTTNGILTTLVLFNGANGRFSTGGLVLGSDGNFYGTAASGGSGGWGTVFKVTTNGVLTTVLSFTYPSPSPPPRGIAPYGGLVLGGDGSLYGTVSQGGENGGSGAVFRITTNGVFTSLGGFNYANGASPRGRLLLANDGHLYGTTHFGGSSGLGTVFQVATNGGLTSLISFARPNGINPSSRLALGNDGNLYGTTAYGGSGEGYGTVFQMRTNGALTTLVSFDYDTNGAGPNELVLGSDGHFYGTTERGTGDNGGTQFGTVFKVTTNGALTSLVSFHTEQSANPLAGLVLGSDGDFYGTTAGLNIRNPMNPIRFPGTVFKVSTNGLLSTLATFDGTNGWSPLGGLVLGRDGNFYGTTAKLSGSFGLNDPGTVFQITTNGVLTTLVFFNGTNGSRPEAGLVLGNDGSFYGTTANGGSNDAGTVFKVTTNGVLTTLVSFTGANGANPRAGLVLGTDGNFYGTTYGGGSRDYGTIFKMSSAGSLATLVSFNNANGANPQAGLVLGYDGYFYGTTANGGPGGGGTIFRLVLSAFTSVARQPGGSLLLTGTGPPSGSYRLWASPDLSLPVASWTLLTSASFDSNGNFSYTDASATTNPSRFYQLSVP